MCWKRGPSLARPGAIGAARGAQDQSIRDTMLSTSHARPKDNVLIAGARYLVFISSREI